jgi:FkbH-like protein
MGNERLVLIADFNAETFARYLQHTALPGWEIVLAPYDQVYQTLASDAGAAGSTALVWTQPHGVVDTFRRARDFEPVDPARAIEEVQAFAAAVSAFARRCRYVFVPTWTQPLWDRGYGMLDARPGVGLTDLLARMNLALADALADEPSVFVLDASRWMTAAGARAAASKLWYASKNPFSPPVFEEAAADLAAALDGLAGRARRLIILDLDDVLWGGIVGEVGWEGITLGGHDHTGEAFADFQRALKALTRRGIQLAIASKNDAAAALEVFDRHPEMQLRRDDVAAWRINWSDKGENVADILRELKLGAESAVFIDDSPSERARVLEAVPGVLAPDWPTDPARYRETLRGLRCFDAPLMTAEDRARTGMYAAERSRHASLSTATSLESWLQSLHIRIAVEALTAANVDRAAQLMNKTNQMNMATRRLSVQELQDWAGAADHLLLTFRVADRFGDYGLTGIIGLAFDRATVRLTDFLLSCRVMGRMVEEAMLSVAVEACRSRGASKLIADFSPTARNGPCLEFFRRSGLAPAGDHQFSWDLSRNYECPGVVSIHRSGSMFGRS